MYRQFNETTNNNMIDYNDELVILDYYADYEAVCECSYRVDALVAGIQDVFKKDTAKMLQKLITLTFAKDEYNSFLVKSCINVINTNPNRFHDDLEFLQTLLNEMMPVIRNYREEAVMCRQAISKIYIRRNLITDAVEILLPALNDENQRFLQVSTRMGLNIEIATIYLQQNSVKDAEVFTNRASQLLPEITDVSYQTKYKIIYASLLDTKGRYMEASQRYMELSLNPAVRETKDLLKRATVSAILVPASLARGKLLTNLCKDDRCKSFVSYPVLEKMSLNRLISHEEMETIRPLIQSFHNLKSEQIYRVLTESNLLSISILYSSISIKNAAKLLDICMDSTEVALANMISDGRLNGFIDQMSGFVRFPRSFPLSAWDRNIESICHSINSVVEKIQFKHPEWVPKSEPMDVTIIPVSVPPSSTGGDVMQE